MKISYLLPDFGKTGGYIVIYNFMDNLVKRGYKVFAITPEHRLEWEPSIWQSFLFKGRKTIVDKIIKEIKRPFKKFANRNDPVIFNAVKRFTKGLMSNWVKSDITISTYCLTSYANFYLSDSTLALYHMQHFEELFFKDNLSRMMARNTYYLPLSLISNSSWLRNIIKDNFGRESYLLCPGIDTKLFSPFNNNPADKYYFKKKWTIVTYYGSADWKGFSDARRVIKKVREALTKDGIYIEWKVFGLAPSSKIYNTEEFNYIGKLFNRDLAKLYSEADIVLCPSWYESFPLPPIEAMACGALVVTTRYGTEDYAFDGINTLVTKPRNIEEMSNKIMNAIKNPDKIKKLVENSIAIGRKFNWEESTNNLETIFKNAQQRYLGYYKERLVNSIDRLIRGIF